VISNFVRILWLLLGWLELTLLTAPLYLLSFLPGEHRGTWYNRLFRIWSRSFVHALGVDLRLHQKNRRALPERFLMVANHPSAFEDVGIPALFDVDCLAKQEVGKWWIVGRISVAAGTLFVNRESKTSRGQAVQAIENRLETGRSVALYPEGGVKGKRLYERFNYGVFDISLRTGIPILPVYIHYEAQDDFHWSNQTLIRKIFDLMMTRNNRANYYLYDAFDPGDFRDKVHYSDHVRECFLEWQKRYLD